MVERNLAKVEVAGSNPVSRSTFQYEENIMKYLLIIPVIFANFVFAEIYEDYEPSQQVTELTVISVQPNYMDDYLVNLKKTWVRSSEIQKELGHIVDYAVWTSEVANSPNLWITVTYENMGAMQQSKEKYDAVNKLMAERFSESEDEYDTISKSYEEIRKMVDHQILNRAVSYTHLTLPTIYSV